jgi:y4mF family transcriptional regulator
MPQGPGHVERPRYFPFGKQIQEAPMPQPTPTTRIQAPADLGAAVRAARKRAGLTLAETAGLTAVGVRFLSELENGKPTVRLDKVLHVLSALGLQLHLADPVAEARGDADAGKR